MKAIISTLQEVDIRFLAIDAGVRYWEDGKINGRQDDADAPSMPFSESGRWRIIIDIDSGVIVNWPKGATASVHYKVCDDGIYELRSANNELIKRIDNDYVPSVLCPDEPGYGDYIIMTINEYGCISGWDKNKIHDMY